MLHNKSSHAVLCQLIPQLPEETPPLKLWKATFSCHPYFSGKGLWLGDQSLTTCHNWGLAWKSVAKIQKYPGSRNLPFSRPCPDSSWWLPSFLGKGPNSEWGRLDCLGGPAYDRGWKPQLTFILHFYSLYMPTTVPPLFPPPAPAHTLRGTQDCSGKEKWHNVLSVAGRRQADSLMLEKVALGKVPMIVNLSCQLDCTWNQLNPKLLGALLLRGFLSEITIWSRKMMHSKSGPNFLMADKR